MHVLGGTAKRNTGSLQREDSLRRDWIPKAMQTRGLISTLIFSSVAAWERGTLINTGKKGLSFQSNSTIKESKT